MHLMHHEVSGSCSIVIVPIASTTSTVGEAICEANDSNQVDGC